MSVITWGPVLTPVEVAVAASAVGVGVASVVDVPAAGSVWSDGKSPTCRTVASWITVWQTTRGRGLLSDPTT